MDYLKCFEPAFAACGFKMNMEPSAANSSVTIPSDGTLAEGSVAVPQAFQDTAVDKLHATISRLKSKFDSETARSMEANVKADAEAGSLKKVAFTCPKNVETSQITLFVSVEGKLAKAVATCTVTLDAEKGTGVVSEWNVEPSAVK
jgi:hypothetical protein